LKSRYGLLSAPLQDKLAQGQEGTMRLAYGAALGWRAVDSD
jgi:hypothetical protein